MQVMIMINRAGTPQADMIRRVFEVATPPLDTFKGSAGQVSARSKRWKEGSTSLNPSPRFYLVLALLSQPL